MQHVSMFLMCEQLMCEQLGGVCMRTSVQHGTLDLWVATKQLLFA